MGPKAPISRAGNDDDGHVAVNDGGQAHLEAAGDSAIQRFAVAKLFFDALSGDNVGVNAHTDTKDDTGDTGQGQRGAIEHGEVTGNKCQRGDNLAKQRDDRNGTGQTVTHDHEQSHKGKGNDAGQHHHIQALSAQGGADGGEAFGREGKRQRTGVNLVCQRGDLVLGERTFDHSVAVRDGSLDGSGGDVLAVQPDGDGAVGLGCQLGGGLSKLFGTVSAELQLNNITVLLVVACGCGRHIVTAQDLFAVGSRALAEHHLGGGSDLVNGGLGIKVGFAGFPGETDDDAVLVIVHIILIVGNAKADQTVFDDGFGRGHLVIGGFHTVSRHERHVHAAADVDTEADILRALDVDVLGIAVCVAHAEQGGKREHDDQQRRDNQMPRLPSLIHMYLQTLPAHRHGRGFITGVCALPHTAMQGSSRLPESRRLFPFFAGAPGRENRAYLF